MNLEDAREFMRVNHRAVLATSRSDGKPQLSPVTVGVDALCVMTDAFFGAWIQAEGTVEIIRLPEAMDLLVDYYRRISGEHPDWEDYRAAMRRERRVIVAITLTRAGPDRSG
jgi:hypothetical protein